jgi:hypothetical protein
MLTLPQFVGGLLLLVIVLILCVWGYGRKSYRVASYMIDCPHCGTRIQVTQNEV